MKGSTSNEKRLFRLTMTVVVILLVIAVPAVLAGTITVDGANTSNEWDTYSPIVSDSGSDSGSDDTDITDVYITNDADYLYFRIDTASMPPNHGNGREVDIYLDTDQNGSTGCDDTIAYGSGYEGRIHHYRSGGIWYTDLEECVSSSWTLQSSGSFGYGAILEFGAYFTDVGVVSEQAFDAYIHTYLTRNPSGGDYVPNSGNFTFSADDWDPTAVILSSFTAAWDGDQVAVAWETTLEVNTLGFNVWRSTAVDSGYAQVNDALVPAASPGGVIGGSYTFTDPNVMPGTTYYYKLEELEVGGARNWYGPTSTDGGDPNAVTLSAADAAMAWWPIAVGVAAGAGMAATVLLRRRRTSS